MGEVKHLLLAKFKEDISEEQIKECIQKFANLVNLIPPLKAFKWGKEMSLVDFHQGFSHIFELSFESAEGVVEYMAHPHHEDFASFLSPKLEKMVIVDFKLTNL